MGRRPYARLPLRGAGKATAEFIVAAMQTKSYEGISADDLQCLLASGTAVTVVDCRDEASYRLGHIPGALNVPFRTFSGEYHRIPTARPVVTVCYFGYYSRAAAQRLSSNGYESVTSLIGGVSEWMRKGYALDSSEYECGAEKGESAEA